MGNLGTQPEWIDVTFAGLTACTGCTDMGTGEYWTPTTPITVGTWNGNTFRLPHTTGCNYRVDSVNSGSYGVIKRYSSAGCGAPSLIDTFTYNSYAIALSYLSSTSYQISLGVAKFTPPTRTVLIFRNISGVIASQACFDVDGDVLSNTTNCGSAWHSLCTNGTATLTL